MAEFQNKSKSPHVDMTPMVDLGFLLITFFMLATTFSHAKVIPTLVPADSEGVDPPKLNCNRSLTLLIDASDFVKYYTCPPTENGDNAVFVPDSVDFSKAGLRQLIVRRQKETKTFFKGENLAEKPLIVLLKATDKARYKHLIDAIDELNITNAQFTLAKVEAIDSTFLKIK